MLSNKTIDILYAAKKTGIDILLNENELQLKLPNDAVLDAGLLDIIKSNKEAIIDFLKNEKYQAEKIDANKAIIRVADRSRFEYIPLSFAQERLWFIHQLEGSIPYHMPTALRLMGVVYFEALQQAFKSIVNRHEVLRTVFAQHKGEAYQRILDKDCFQLHVIDGSHYKQDPQALQALISELTMAPFDLGKDHMLRAHLIRLSTDEHVLVITTHHIASDGWSGSIFVQELEELYNAYIEEREPRLKPLMIQYADYAIWQRQYFQGNILDEKLKYWKERLADVSPLNLPTDLARPAIQSTRGAAIVFVIGKEVTEGLLKLGRQHDCTLYMVLLAAFRVLLYRYSGQEDICIGSAIANRTQQETESLIGFFVNMLAIRSKVSPDVAFTNLLQQVKEATLEAYEHQDAPFEKVVEVVLKDRDMSRTPLFQAVFNLQNNVEAEIEEEKLGEVKLSFESAPLATTQFEINCSLTETTEGITGVIEYCTDLYTEETIGRMAAHYEQLLRSIVKAPHQQIGELSILTGSERLQLLETFNDTKTPVPAGQTITALFEEQAALTPDAIAVKFEKEQLTYKALNERANQLGHYLREKGIKEECLVPVCLERSLEMIVGILAILKAGGAYVPIDPEYPADRIQYILQQTGATIALSTNKPAARLSNAAIDIIDLNEIGKDIAAYSRLNVQNELHERNLAYVLFTSGSTGEPKGVMTEHKAIVNRLLWAQSVYKLTTNDTVLQKTTYCFDVSVWELLWPLLAGAKLVFAQPGAQKEQSQIQSLIEEEQVTLVHFVPSMLEVFLSALRPGACSSLQNVLCSGEALKATQVKLFKEKLKGAKLHNLYGPTEAAIDVTYWSLPQTTEDITVVPIGKPVANTAIHILDARNELVPVGVVGEICIGGVQVARGYLNRADLTAEKFIIDPFDAAGNARLYKTGDLGRWLANGNVEYLGRLDDQVKIRGFRIELGEVEAVLQQHASISQAVVTAKEDHEGNKRLIGYVVPKGTFDKGAVTAWLQSKLPEYMVPATLIALEQLPLTPNGKIDKKALPDPEVSKLITNAYVAPRNNTEAALVGVWQHLLKVERIGVNDNFFDLGGHSLLAMRMLSAIAGEMEVELMVKDILLHPTIARLTAHLEQQNKGRLLPRITALPRPARIPLSFAQERLWFIDQLEGSVQYHTPFVLRLHGVVNDRALQYAFQNIVNRHEVLRTVFEQQEGLPYQQLLEMDGFVLNLVTDPVCADQQALGLLIEELITLPFDLRKDHMVRAHLIRIDEGDQVLVVTMHHIASDGWSMPIFESELLEYYNAYIGERAPQLQPLEIQYADYAIWQRQYLQGAILDKKLAYWHRRLTGVLPLNMPTDFTRPAVQSTRGSAITFNINAGLTGSVYQLCREQDVTMFMTLLAAFKVLLHRYSDQEDICIGVPIANRMQQETEGLIGFFVNSLALRSEVNADTSFTSFLQQVKETTLEAYAHQDAPFEKVVETVVKEREMNRNPLYQVSFVLQNNEEAEIKEEQLGNMELSHEFFEHHTSRFDMLFSVTETPDGLMCLIEYCTDLYKKETIARMAGHYEQLLQSIVASPIKRIGDLSMVTEREQFQLLKEYNNTKAAIPTNQTVVHLFEAQAAAVPEAIALVYGEEQLTYKELNERANQLAHMLQREGVKQESLVPVCIERNINMVVAILGVMKAGGAYVPIDPEFPVNRIRYMLEDAGAHIVVASSGCASKLPNSITATVIEIDGKDADRIKEISVEDPLADLRPGHLAYVIYTSGSTGEPKGVMIEHRNLLNYLLNNKTNYIKEEDGTGISGSYIYMSYTFDASLTGIFMPLITGKRVVINAGNSIDVFKDQSFVKYAPYHFIKLTPAHLPMLEAAIKEVGKNRFTNRLVIGGEALQLNHLRFLIESGAAVEIVNEYGPTEATVGCSTYSLYTNTIDEQANENVSIGRPIDNVSIYIVDKRNQPVPVGVPGEICIGGAGVARGYLKRPDLTAEKFISDPFDAAGGSRIYKTGDMGRWHADGSIEYIGRTDDQVKIRGYRIELGEIENVMNRLPVVASSSVAVKQHTTDSKALVGYYIPDWHTVKQLETELYHKSINNWQDLYNTEYGKIDEEPPLNEEFNIIGWNDSFTGGVIPEEQMREWLEDIARVILSEPVEKVLEIGCGTGLIYYRLAAHIKQYTGTDFSRVPIAAIQARLAKNEKYYPETVLKVCAAHEVAVDTKPDTIIINSVVQYFPALEYLGQVIDSCIAQLGETGRIIIGDVRDNRLLKLFKSRLLLNKLPANSSIKEFEWNVEQAVLREEELCISPEYFYALQQQYPRISQVEICLKEGNYSNELSLYRYTVIIYVGQLKEVIDANWQLWDGIINKSDITDQLKNGVDRIAIQGAPNPRLWQERSLHRSIKERTAGIVQDIREAISQPDEESSTIQHIVSEASSQGYTVRWFVHEDALSANLLLERTRSNGYVKVNYNKNASGAAQANMPLLQEIQVQLQQAIRLSLQERLPEYMIPASFIAMEKWPLTINGKINRKQLPDPNFGEVLQDAYVAPRNQVEETLAIIWKDLLNIGRVGVNDNFFELGGHSLLAIRLITAIRKQLTAEVSIVDIFDHPTIASLAEQLKKGTAVAVTPSFTRQERPAQIPLSFAQERLWFIHQLEGSVQYHMPSVLRLKGNINSDVLEAAFQTIVNRHEVLRTVIVQQEEKASQRVLDKNGFKLRIIDGAAHGEDERAVPLLIEELVGIPFDLHADHMIRAHLIQLQPDDQILVVTMHHIAADGWSMPIIVNELKELYNAGIEERSAQLAPLGLQYADYAIWQRSYLQGNVLNEKLAYWQNRLTGVSPLNMPTDWPRPRVQSTRGAATWFQTDKKLTDQLNQLCRQQDTTLFMTLLAAFKVLLFRYSGQEDLCVGSAIANRTQHEAEGLIGLFVNTLALRSEVNGEMCFTSLLQQIKTTTLNAFAHQDTPFEKVVEVVIKERDLSRSPLFQVMFDVQNNVRAELGEEGFSGISLSDEVYTHSKAKFDFTYSVTETENGLITIIEYCTDLYKEETMLRMAGHYNQLLQSIVAAPGQRISELALLPAPEKHQLLVEFNDTGTTGSTDSTIVELFEAQAARTPENIAVIFGQEQLTYRELNERANKLGHYLRKKGIKEEQLVPVCLESSVAMIVGIWGILKAGGAYVPIDPEYPGDRIQFMLKDTLAAIAISSASCKSKMPAADELEIIDLDGDWETIAQCDAAAVQTTLYAGNLAYVLYTSGSTGRPKGVMIEHGNLVNYIQNSKTHYISKEENAGGAGSYAHLSFTFDASLTGLFMPLITGKTIVLGVKRSTEVFEDDALLKYAPFDFIKLTPAHLPMLEAAIKAQPGKLFTKRLVIGGEALQTAQIQFLREQPESIEIINEYGPTEATVGCSTWWFNTAENKKLSGDAIPIGQPIDNVTIYIIDKWNQLVPVGVPGEICIGGNGLARGYLNRPDLTAEKFIKDPFAINGGLLYKTGDTGRWLEDGNIEYIGRTDEQVKVRGYRIELGEIEAVLQQHELVSQAVVVAREDAAGTKKLVAYFVPKEAFDREVLSNWLQSRLPEYMVPAIWVAMQSLPLTSNGKIDKKALPAPNVAEQLASLYVAPRTETETIMANIWQDLLEIERVGVYDNFFSLGGHSLLAIRLISAIRKELKAEVSIGEIFDHPTIDSLGTLLQRAPLTPVLPSIPIVQRPDRVPLSFAQERIWFIHQLEGSIQYHMPAVLRLQGNVNSVAIEFAFRSIVNRHEVLRTVFDQHEGQPFQRVLPKDGWQLEIIDSVVYKNDAVALQLLIDELISKPFDLGKDHMIRAHLVRLNEGEQVLISTVHHIASDGWSMPVVTQELEELYNAYIQERAARLQPIKVQYADYALWQRRHLQGELLNKKLAYWKNRLAGVQSLKLPTDFVRPAVQSTKGAMNGFRIEKELADELYRFCQQHDVTLFMTLLAAFKVLLYRYCGQEDICVGVPVANRTHHETEELIGFFVNMLAVRTAVNGQASFVSLLQQVKETTLEAYEHQDMPFEKIVEAVIKERDMNRNPVFQVTFALQNNKVAEIKEENWGEVAFSPEYYGHKTSRFDCTFSMVETNEGIDGAIEYCTDLFRKETVVRMGNHFQQLLQSIVRSPEQCLDELLMATQQEQSLLLIDYNDTKAPIPTDKTITDLFEAQVARTPDYTALVFGNEQITYKALNERANQLAHYLKGRGVQPGSLVPICMERGLELIVGLLGILKAGGAYVPIDAAYPAERIGFMLQDTGAAIVISNTACKSSIPLNGAQQLVDITGDWENISQYPSAALPSDCEATDLAYVIYTSGSTGQPKGVMIEHRAVVNLIDWHIEEYTVTTASRSTAMATVGFDAFGWEVWPYLCAGASIHLLSDDMRLLPAELVKYYKTQDITHTFIATALVNEFVKESGRQLPSLQYVLTGGDVLAAQDTANLNYRLVNNYGPTENTVVATRYVLSARDKEMMPCIGAPIANTQVYILDSAHQLTGIGIAGEICIGGAQVARGYLNRAKLTAEKFIPNPFDATGSSRLYKTGDLGRWLPDGNIEYIGRADEQVKIRGYRIELGEIETVLNNLAAVSTGAVIVKQDEEGNKSLMAYYTPDGGTVKLLEQTLYEKQIENWQELYNTEYSQVTENSSGNEEFNIIGWNDSFTGTSIPEEQMKEWLDDIVSVILSAPVKNVLEIGCGTGLIYYRLADHVQCYTGTDISKVSVSGIEARIAHSLKRYPKTILKVCSAHEVAVSDSVDTIVINSVIQYFPALGYLQQVISRCISMLEDGGRIIIGDVRDDRLLKLFKSRLLLNKLPGSASIKELEWETGQSLLWEEELCISPDYFYNLAGEFPQISHVEVRWKQGDHLNELTLYRYTVIIHVGTQKELVQPNWQLWDGVMGKDDIIEKLNSGKELVALQDVPNYRLWKERILHQLLNEKPVNSVADINAHLSQIDKESEVIKQLQAVARSNNYTCRLLLHKDPLKVNMIFEQQPVQGFIIGSNNRDRAAVKTNLSNIPLWQDIGSQLQQDIHRLLQDRLPKYMVPAQIIALEQLPLTANGKIDRRRLAERNDAGRSNNKYEAPHTETEKIVAAIWESLLNIKQAGIAANFFELGGHSLLATRVVSAIRRELEVELTVKDLFIRPTIKDLAAHIQQQRKGALLPPLEVVEPKPARIPLSFSQERLWFIDQLEGSVPYHMPTVVRLTGKVNYTALEQAFRGIINRHEVLRTVFRQQNGEVWQQVLDKDGFSLDLIDHVVYNEQAASVQALTDELIRAPFDLSKDHMMRAHLIRVGYDHILVITMHHIASDGWSMPILIKELEALYNARILERAAGLKPLAIQYADYAIWQRRYMQGDVLDKKLSYWESRLREVPPINFPADFARPAVQSTKGSVINFEIDKKLADGLTRLCRQQDTTLFMTLLAAFNVLLYRYCRQEDICVGSVIANRTQQETEELIGFFVNTLALRSEVKGEETFTSLLQQVKETTLGAYEHQDVPFERVVDAVVKQRDMSRTPLFQVMLNVQNNAVAAVEEENLGGMVLAAESATHATSLFDIIVTLTETPAGLSGGIVYCTDLYREGTILRLADNYKQLLQSIVASPQQKVSELPMLTEQEKHQLLVTFNDTKASFPADKTIVTLFEEQAVRTPDNIAVVIGEQQLTYAELNGHANQLAHYLREKGIKEESLVPICIERSIDMMVGILGILKAGGAYVPVDPEYPADRIQYMLTDTGAAILLSHSMHTSQLQQNGINIIELDVAWKEIAGYPKTNVQNELLPGNLAYVIYTSGSTGQPKGVMTEHKAIVNRLHWAQTCYQLTTDDAVLQKTTFCFDVSVWELLWPLLAGAKVVFAQPGAHKDTGYLRSIIAEQRITMMHFVPSMLAVFLAEVQPGECGQLQKVLCSGEALKAAQVKLFKEKLPGTALHNLYGPTEAAIDVTYWRMPHTAEEIQVVPIGRPVFNTTLYILDARNELVPVGIAGEICIGGIQVARGYLNRPDLTALKFIKDPFNDNERLYKTGDLGRWLPDGNIEYIGRLDDQVKIRGYRIELGEIEYQSVAVPGIQDAKVIVRENEAGDDKKLQAYLQVDGGRLPLLSNYQLLLNQKQVQMADLHILPNGLPILASNLNEVRFLYKEIFDDRCYLKHGITLHENSCVIDVGANTGFFTVFCNALYPGIKVYSVEPVPEVYNYLVRNRSLYGVKGKAFQLAMLHKEQEIEFTYYLQVSIVSGISEDKQAVKNAVRAYIENTGTEIISEEEIETILDARLNSTRIKCQAKTLSQIIGEEKIETIDLLKVDVENSEHLVLEGLKEEDWAKIQSLVVEVHDVDGRVHKMTELLKEKGFHVFIEKEQPFSATDILYNLYALRTVQKEMPGLTQEGYELRLAGWKHPSDLIKELKQALEKQLPAYMVPAQYVLMDHFPLTPNGKIDKKALPDPDMAQYLENAYAPPRNQTETIVAGIWAELLGIERVGIYDNFFELGGHSLLIIRLREAIKQQLHFELLIKDVFGNPTIAALALHIENAANSY